MTNKISIGDLAEWIIEHRKGEAFKDNTFSELCMGLQEDVEHNRLLFVLDEKEHLMGVVTFTIDHENCIVFVRNILTTRYCALKIFAQHFKEHFEGFALCGNTNNTNLMYDTSRLINHLLNMKGRV